MEQKWFFVERWPKNNRAINFQQEIKKVIFCNDEELLTKMKKHDFFSCPYNDGMTIAELSPTGKFISRKDLVEKHFSEK